MALRSTAGGWGSVTRAFHWGMLLLLIGIVSVGYYMTGLPLGAAKLQIYALHKSIGLTLLALVILRALWRLSEQRPALPPMPIWQVRVAIGTHLLLYGLLFLMPLSGWLYNSASGFPLQWFHVLNLPALARADPHLKVLARSLHEIGAGALIGVVALHMRAALKHHFIDNDVTLRRMAPWRGDRF